MWNRREMLGVLGIGTAGFALLTNRSEAGDEPVTHEMSKELRECDEACGHCEAACNEAFHHCITQAAAGRTEHAKLAQLLIDCAGFCTLSATMISRHSSLMKESCRACGEACRRCAEQCGSAPTDEIMKNCVAACKRCEESCRKMVSAMGGEHHHATSASRSESQ
jgi:hypothetical protein